MKSANAHPVILFDGVCNLCESTVQFVIRHDRNSRFRFAQLQSPAAQRLLQNLDSTDAVLSSVLLLEESRLYRKSRAALRITKNLDGLWPVLYYLFFWVPAFIADRVYDFIGDRRYRWFGEKSECWIPNDELRARFLDDSVGRS